MNDLCLFSAKTEILHFVQNDNTVTIRASTIYSFTGYLSILAPQTSEPLPTSR